MPRLASRNHNWNNQDRNLPMARNGIPEERQRLLDRLRGIDESVSENERVLDLSRLNRRERRDRGIVINSVETANNTGGTISNYTMGVDFGRVQPSQLNARLMGVEQLEEFQRHYQSIWSPSSVSIDGIYQPSRSNKFIKSYNYVPEKFIFHKEENENINQYFGIELEIDGAGENDDNAKQVIDFLGEDKAYIKHDGSLSSGFEVVMQPCSYKYHLNQIDYKGLFKLLVGMGYKSHDTQTCGLHVHINKSFFGENKTYQDLNISKLLFLFEKYWDKLVIFSRREYGTINRWARRYEMSNDESMFDVLTKAKYADKECNGKYHSINLKHRDTVEIRIFKGTLKYETFMATLQLVKRLCDVAKDLSIEEVQLITWEELVCSEEIELKEYLHNRKLMVLVKEK